MSRWMPAVAAGALLALVVLAALFALRPPAAPTAAERTDLLAGQLRCPDCQGLSVADSPTRSAQEIRRQIDELLASGASNQAVRDHFVARYGDWILLAPSSPVPWLIPFGVVLSAAVGLGAWLVRARRVPSPAAATLSIEERRRLHDEAEALDA